jgi:dTMP kinase
MTLEKPPRRRPVRPQPQLSPQERQTLDEVMRAHVRAVLEACHGNQTNAARALGIDRKTLARSMRRWRLPATPEPRELRVGSLIAIEGIDGAGITTQAKRLVAHLSAREHPAVMTCEPSDGPVGELLKQLLAHNSLAPAGMMRTLSLLFAADRVDHYHRVVAPALAAGTTVVSDRWYHSSLAYQRTGVEREWIAALNRHTRIPDVTVFLDVPPEVGLARRKAAGRVPELFHDLEIARSVVGGYRVTIGELRAEGERIEIVDGDRSEHAVFGDVLRAIGISPRKRD